MILHIDIDRYMIKGVSAQPFFNSFRKAMKAFSLIVRLLNQEAYYA